MDKEKLIGNIKHWIELDEEIKVLQKQIKAYSTMVTAPPPFSS